jgi:hypothetical protein
MLICALPTLGAVSVFLAATGSVSANCGNGPDGLPVECPPPCTNGCNGGGTTTIKNTTNSSNATAGAAAQATQSQTLLVAPAAPAPPSINTYGATSAPNLPQGGTGIAAQSSVQVVCGAYASQTSVTLGSVTTSTGGVVNILAFGVGGATQTPSIPLGDEGVKASLRHVRAAAAQAEMLGRLNIATLAASAAGCQPKQLPTVIPPGNTPVVPGSGGAAPDRPGKTNG